MNDNPSQANPPKKRIFYLDQLRALAIVAIILIHVSNLWAWSSPGSFNWDMRYLFRITGIFGVPVFLMLSGVLLLNRDYKIWDFMKRRFPRVLIPFVFWTIIAIIIGVISQDLFSYFNSVATTVPYIVETFLTSRWYVWMIIGVYLVMPIINDFVKNRGLKGVEYFLLLWFITSILYSLSLYFNQSMYFLDLSFFAGPLGYVLLGYYLHNKEFNFSPDKLMIIGLVLFISSILIKTFLVYNGQLDPALLRYYIFQTKTYLDIDILSFLQAIGIFMVFKYLNHENTHWITNKISSFLKEGIIGKFTASISRSSYGIYLNHYIFIGIISVSGFNLIKHSALKWIPFLVIVVLLCAWVSLLILDKIPYLKKVTGYN